MRELDLGLLIEVANRRHADTTAAHIAAMIDDPKLDFAVGIWSDPTEPGGVANFLFKGADLEYVGGKRKRSVVAFWLRGEASVVALRQELKELVIKGATDRGEFTPIADDLAFEFVPTSENIEALYVVKAGVRIARRGRPGTRERKRWIPLFPEYMVRDLSPNSIEIFAGDAKLRLGRPH